MSPFLIDGRIALWVFDFDGNILRTPTKIYLVDTTTGSEVEVEGHYLDQHPEIIRGPDAQYKLHEKSYRSFSGFVDFADHPEHLGVEQLLSDIDYALENNNFSTSFESFKNTFLIKARIFSIITARGHSWENMARAMTHINDKVLTTQEKEEQYENICELYETFEWKEPQLSQKEAVWYYFNIIARYYPVSSTITTNWLWIHRWLPNSTKKTHAMREFIKSTKAKVMDIPNLKDKSISLGFSDDSLSNIEAMITFLEDERTKRDWVITPNDKVKIYFTGKQSEAKKLEKLWRNLEYGIDMTIIRI